NRQARAAYAALIRLAEESRNTARLRDLIKEIAARYPEDREPVNDLAYLDLLLQTDLPQATQKARELVEKYPHVLAFRTTLALANLRNKEFTAARLAYSGVEVDWSLALPGWRAVYAAVLGANGLRDEARRVASAIPLDRLKVEERLLVQPFL
ncbi:MAG TPA: hypothetical protein VHH73_12570, partial [Verrucomicrobiae bacterium]|nr:hypothetical protein [Verrucomicrobiae bacterium]